ncbi:hypothetical protein NtRootA1_11290 [Arthrobacter sp. NtRootA1]|nr:hypothetical protein NtRootA1_11290 [Arthrobacter sp. NtRootA1]
MDALGRHDFWGSKWVLLGIIRARLGEWAYDGAWQRCGLSPSDWRWRFWWEPLVR